MLWIPYLSDYLFRKFTDLVMVITWWYLTVFVHQDCLFTFRNSALIRISQLVEVTIEKLEMLHTS